VVGTSMGCAVIWSYVELFGTARLQSAVFVDQVRNSDYLWGFTSHVDMSAMNTATLPTE
jgi:hypothetical protein